MPFELQRYTEPLETEELAFLIRKEEKERKQYYKVFDLFMVLSFIIPFAGAWHSAYVGAPNAFSPLRYFLSVGVLLALFSTCFYLTYRLNLHKLQLDIRHKTKTVETHHITRKVCVATGNTCYFYIDSRIKLSIEVKAVDYARLSEGDEVSIEYTTHGMQYLGYF